MYADADTDILVTAIALPVLSYRRANNVVSNFREVFVLQSAHETESKL